VAGAGQAEWRRHAEHMPGPPYSEPCLSLASRGKRHSWCGVRTRGLFFVSPSLFGEDGTARNFRLFLQGSSVRPVYMVCVDAVLLDIWSSIERNVKM
jgi:hypothetical protein